MDFHAPYFGPDEPMDDRPYEFYPMTMPFDSIRCVSLSSYFQKIKTKSNNFHYRYRGHFGRYDPGGFH